MNLPLEGRISGPNTGFEVTVPGRQGIRAMRHSIPLAGAPTSIATSLRGLLFFCSALFLPVVSRQRRAPCSIARQGGFAPWYPQYCIASVESGRTLRLG